MSEITQTSLDDHHDVGDLVRVNVEAMELSTNADGWSDFPGPDEIVTYLDEDYVQDYHPFPDHVREAVDQICDEPEPNEFLVFDADAAYGYLEELQIWDDVWLEYGYRHQLGIDMLPQTPATVHLSDYDRKWIVQWEVRRRLAEMESDRWPNAELRDDNHGLPDATGGDEP